MSHTHKEDYGDSFIEDFLDIFEEYSIGNRAYGRMILHVIIGQSLKNIYFKVGERKIDIRMHLLFIKPSGSGGGAGYGLYSRVAKDIGLNDQMLTEATDAGLVGAGTQNIRTGEMEVTEGLMTTADVISMEEASTLFDYTTDFSKKNLTYLQIAMNPLHDSSCYINKKIGSIEDAISFKPHCSFVLVTYLPDQYIPTLVKRGTLQRFVNVMKDVSLEERSSVVDVAIEKMRHPGKGKGDKEYSEMLSKLKVIVAHYQKLSGYSNTSNTLEYDDDILNNLIDGLFKKKISDAQKESIINNIKRSTKQLEDSEWYINYGYEFKITDDALDGLQITKNSLTKMIEDTTWIAQEKLAEFTHRNFEIVTRFAIHHAILCLRNTVEMEDVIYARDVYEPIWKKIIYNVEDLLEPSPTQKGRWNSIVFSSIQTYKNMLKERKYVRDNVWIRRNTFLERLQRHWDYCSAVTANNRFHRIETTDEQNKNKIKYFLTKKIGNVYYVKLIQDIERI